MPVTGAKPPHERMTITPVVIEAAATIVVMATGKGKAQAVARALRGPADVAGCPAQLARRGLWLLDQRGGGRPRDILMGGRNMTQEQAERVCH